MCVCRGLGSWRVQGSNPHIKLLHIYQADGQPLRHRTWLFVWWDNMLHQLYFIRPRVHRMSLCKYVFQ